MAGDDDLEPVEIVDHDPAWVDNYEAVAEELRRALARWLVAIEHIGSTAVPDLPAKPVIDIQVGVEDLGATPEIVDALASLGFEYLPELEVDLPSRRYFRRRVDGRRTHQVHLVERTNTEWWDRHLAFRDWLRNHPDDRERYASLKRSLAAEHRFDRHAYTDAKSEFVRDIETRARNANA